ncbi:MAG: hypothetical protein H7343_05860 [Undibacterium sp.]|nr:hypothetical protein [Opitutaceae bacterium]
MPEVFAVLIVFVVALFIYVMMWLKSRDPAFYKPKEELVRLQHQVIWLEDRQAVARREHWDAGLQASLVTQIEETVRELDRVKALLAESAGAPAVEAAR